MTDQTSGSETLLVPAAQSGGYWHSVWRRFRRDPVAVTAMIAIAV